MDQGFSFVLAGVMQAVNASGLLTQVASFQLPSGEFSANGFPDGEFLPVDGLTELPCKVSSSRFDREAGATVKTMARQLAEGTGYVLFGAYYPQAEAVWRNGGRLVVDGVVYANEDLISVGGDSMGTHTSCLIRLVTE